jgi:hypothetical protein
VGRATVRAASTATDENVVEININSYQLMGLVAIDTHPDAYQTWNGEVLPRTTIWDRWHTHNDDMAGTNSAHVPDTHGFLNEEFHHRVAAGAVDGRIAIDAFGAEQTAAAQQFASVVRPAIDACITEAQ